MENKIIFLCLTTEKYNNRRDNILKTWGKDVNLLFYSEHEEPQSNVIKVCDVNDAEIKQCSIFQYIRDNNLDYEWYFFCDDDTFVNTKFLIQNLETFEKNCVTGQDIYGAWQDLQGYIHYPAGGAGFIMSKNIIHNFFDLTSYGTTWGDVSVGLKMREKKIEMIHNTKFLRLSNDDDRTWIQPYVSLENVKNYYTFHYIDTYEKMNLLYLNCI